MTGGLFQLVAKGSEDLHITGDPQITPFKLIYRQITQFSLFDKIIYPKTNTDFSSTVIFPIKELPICCVILKL